MDNKTLKNIANTIRALSMDGVQKANSGHPGLPMGMADVASVLFSEFLKFNPKNPDWFNRDRFVLSGGHGSMLLYSLLHLYGYDLSLDDLKEFRQWHSKTPGHPELQDTPGIETTTGPLGQGISNAVGMAWSETFLAAKFNQDKNKLVNHYTYVFAGDGDLQEGISHESCSFAGHNKLGKLVLFYDSNKITIDGETKLSFSEDVKKRFKSYNWHVQKVDGHNYKEIKKAIKKAKKETDKPSIIICKTIIGYGSPNKQGKEESHGAPLGVEEVKLTKQQLGISTEDFFIPSEVFATTQSYIQNGEKLEAAWQQKLEKYKPDNSELFESFSKIINKDEITFKVPVFEAGGSMATRIASGKVIEALAEQINTLIGGSADLTPSNKTKAGIQESYSPKNRQGNYIRYGVREFGMGGIMNGIALHSGLVPYSGTFFVFSDYMRSSIRMAALMGIRVIYVFTHDSIGLGEDGPTHQPVEHISSLRTIPNLVNIRPMDANETAIAWKIALERKNGPTTLILSRQNMTIVDRSEGNFAKVENAEKGGYVLIEDENYEAIIIATGSEVEIALEAKELLNKENTKVRIVSMPTTELFDEQSDEYRESVLPNSFDKVVAVEAGAKQTWYKYVGKKGKIIGMDSFGASAPYKTLYEKFGITANTVADAVKSLL
ncbi:MAG: transketolase [Bacteroidetes bacterium]|nr:MAG: transketolase [Bacteroidota bacterium]